MTRGGALVTLSCLLALLVASRLEATSDTGFVKILSIDPAPGSTVQSDTIVKAEVQYQIKPFDATARYMLVPMFEAIDHIKFNDLMDGTKLVKRAGTVRMNYPIRRQVSDPKLDKPMKLTFAIVKTQHGFFGPSVSSEEVTYEIK